MVHNEISQCSGSGIGVKKFFKVMREYPLKNVLGNGSYFRSVFVTGKNRVNPLSDFPFFFGVKEKV
jgi:hypothetical protein